VNIFVSDVTLSISPTSRVPCRPGGSVFGTRSTAVDRHGPNFSVRVALRLTTLCRTILDRSRSGAATVRLGCERSRLELAITRLNSSALSSSVTWHGEGAAMAPYPVVPRRKVRPVPRRTGVSGPLSHRCNSPRKYRMKITVQVLSEASKSIPLQRNRTSKGPHRYSPSPVNAQASVAAHRAPS